MTSESVSQLQGEATSHEERLKRKAMDSPTAMDCNSEESEVGGSIHKSRPFEGFMSVSDCAHGNEIITPTTNANISPQSSEPGLEKRFAGIENMLKIQQELLQKLISAQEPSPPPLPVPKEIYERAREKAQCKDFHRWDSFYIHGLIRIDGETSRSMTKDPPCEQCEAYDLVCTVLTEEDPYREFIFVERKVCCGWCEYSALQSKHIQRNQETHQVERLEECSSSGRMNHQNVMEDKHPEEGDGKRLPVFFIDGHGIDREVITTDIGRYLGNDAIVRPGKQKGISGYHCTAYRAPTSAMLSDLRADSAKWQAEKEKSKSNKQIPRDTQQGDSSTQSVSARLQYNSGAAADHIIPAGRGANDYTYGYPTGVRFSPETGPSQNRIYISRPDRTPTPCEEPPAFHNEDNYY